jgi:hypothetical protein
MQDARCRIEMARIPITWHLGPGTRHRSRSDAEGRIPSTEDRAWPLKNAHTGYASCILHPFLNKAVEPTPGIRPPHRHPVPSSPLHSSLRHSVTPSLLSWVTAPISLDILEQTLTNLDSTKVHKMATPHHGCGGRPRREGGPIALRYHTCPAPEGYGNPPRPGRESGSSADCSPTRRQGASPGWGQSHTSFRPEGPDRPGRRWPESRFETGACTGLRRVGPEMRRSGSAGIRY